MYILLALTLLITSGLSIKSSLSMFEHSYFASMSDSYLSYERLSYYQQMKYFTDLCPVPTAIEFLSLQKTKFLEFAYTQQETQYLSNEQFLERAASVGTLEKLFGFLFQSPQPQTVISESKQDNSLRREASVKNSIAEFYTNNYDFREAIFFNQNLKARVLIAIIFLSAFILVLYRLSKQSESAKQKIPKTVSIFWFFATIQLYLELNWLSAEPQTRPNSKTLFISLLPYDQTTNYIPEAMNLLLFVVCLIYFFSLIFRFNEIFGSEEQDTQYMEHINQLATSVSKDKKAKQGQGSHVDKVEEIIDESDDDFSISGFATQPIVQVPPIGVKTALELYHFVIIHLTLFLTFLKLIMLCEGLLFVKVSESNRISILDNLEIFPFTPRYLAMFTVSFLAFSEYIGKSSTDRTQYNFQKICPFLIAVLHTLILIVRRRYLLTVDDIAIGIVFATSFSLYLSLEYKRPLQQAKDTPKKAVETRQLKKNTALSNDGKPKLDKGKRINKDEFELRSRTFSQDQKDLLREADLRSRQQHIQSFEKAEDYTYSDIDDDSSTESQQPSEEAEKVRLRKIPIQKLQDMLFSQLRDIPEEDTTRIFQYGGEFDVNNEMHLIQRLSMIEQIKRREAYQQQQALQGGQGQQSNQNLKQTAHKVPTKAPSGRPNPRKRR